MTEYQPAYLVSHDAAVAELREAALLLYRVIRCTEPVHRGDPLTPVEIAVIAGHAAQLPSVQAAAAVWGQP